MTVVRLDDGVPPRPAFKPTFGDCRAPGVAPRVRPLVVPMQPPEGASALVHETQPETTAEKPLVGELATERSIGLEHPIAALPDHAIDMPAVVVVPSAAIANDADPDSTTASRSAWLATIFAAACAILAVAQYRVILSLPAAGRAAVEPPPLPPDLSTADLAPAAPRAGSLISYRPAAKAPASQEPVGPAAESARPTAVAASRTSQVIARPPAPTPRPAPAPARPPIRSSPPTRPVLPPAVLAARASAPAPASLTSVSPAAARPPAEVASRVASSPVVTPLTVPPPTAVRPPTSVTPPASRAPSASLTASIAAPAPVPVAVLDRDASAVRSVPTAIAVTANADEVDIRSTLTRFRTAYSQLDARAARDVWPSVDARALERAFQSLKSQELRFDRCNLTVTGARAQAACTGRATYVPRIGDQSPRFTSREWAFELRKADERWTIASARAL